MFFLCFAGDGVWHRQYKREEEEKIYLIHLFFTSSMMTHENHMPPLFLQFQKLPNIVLDFGNFPILFHESLQDFTVLPTDQFHRCVIGSSSVIFLPTSSPTNYVRRLSLRRWFPLPSLYPSEKQKNHLSMVLQTEFARQKKKFPLEIYRRIFIPSVILWLTDGKYPSVNPSVSVWNTDRIYPSVNSSVLLAATVKCRRINSVGKSVGEV